MYLKFTSQMHTFGIINAMLFNHCECCCFSDTSRRHLYMLHTITWVGNMFGLFFILAAHEHYSIDVFVAFYISSRLFLYYHVLANNRSLMQRDKNRRRIWFPLFSFFESKCDGTVPNVYEWPFPSLKTVTNFCKAKFSTDQNTPKKTKQT